MDWSKILRTGKILNWTQFDIIKDFNIPVEKIIDQINNYQNLENDSYWRSKMTDEEKEMKKHPNRSWRWIPQRLENQRDELRHTLLDFIVGPENYKKSGFHWGNPCLNCGSSFEIEMEAMILFKNTLTEELGDEYGGESSLEEYTAVKEKGLLLVLDEFGPQIAERLPYATFQQGQVPSSPNRPYGMCGVCYQDALKQMKKIIDAVKV